MDPTTPAPASTYAAATPAPAAGIQPAQLQAILAALKAQEAQGGGSQPAAGTAQPAQGQGQNGPNQNLPFSSAGNVIKGIFNPPPTSILGKAESGIGNALGFGSGSPQPSAGAGAMSPGYQPMDPGSPMNIMPSGAMGGNSSAPMPGSPNAFGAGAVPTPFTQPGSPDAMSQLLMGGGLGF